MSSDKEIIQLYCNKCEKETKHSMLASITQSGSLQYSNGYGEGWDYRSSVASVLHA
jgi:hypothetical protein